MLYELWYWCWQKNEWRRVDEPESSDFLATASRAESLARESRRAVQVRDVYSGDVLHQADAVGYQPLVLHPAFWA